MAREPKDSAEVVPLSRWHARVARAKRLVDADALLAHPQARSLVQGLPVQDLFYLVKRVGLADSLELLDLCQPRQIQGCLDLDAWNRDRLDMARLEPWLGTLLSTSPESVSQAVHGLDPEVWVLFLQQHVRVYDHTPEQADSFGQDQVVVESPDRLYLVEVVEPSSRRGQLALRLVHHLFQAEAPEVWRRLLEACRRELGAELEETEYRFRRGRLEDLGFVDFYEAAEVYAYLDPHRLKRAGPGAAPIPAAGVAHEAAAGLPAPLAGPLGDESFLARVLARVESEDELDVLARQLVGLANRVLSVDQVDVGEPEAVQEATARLRNCLSIAFEFLGDGDLDQARAYLVSRPLREIFRAGFSLTVELKRRADRLFREGWLQRPAARVELLEPAERELLDGLRRRRPVLYAGLDDPRRIDFRDFETLADVAQAHERIDLVETQGWLFLDALGLDPAATPPAHSFANLLRTAFVHQTLGNGFRFEPVTAEDLRGFLRKGMRGRAGAKLLREDAREELLLFLDGRVGERGADARARVRALARPWLAALEEELGALPPRAKIDPRFVGGLWLLGQE